MQRRFLVPTLSPSPQRAALLGLRGYTSLKLSFTIIFQVLKSGEKNVDVIDLEMPWPTNIYLVIKKLLVIHLSKKKKILQLKTY